MAKKTNVIINDKKYYRVRAKIGVDKNGKSIIKPFYGDSKTAAEDKRDEYLDGIKRGLSVDYDKDPFNTVYENWFKTVLSPNIKQSTINRYELLNKLHIQTADFYYNRFASIKSDDIQNHLNGLKSNYTALRVYMLLGAFYKYCLKGGSVIRNVMDSVSRPVHKKTEKKESLTLADRTKLLDDFKRDKKLFIYVFAMFTGMRQGEILALTHKDIDLENNVIDVNKSLNKVKMGKKYQVVISSPKTPESIRQIPLVGSLVASLKEHIEKEKKKHERQGVHFSENNLLFTSNTCTSLRNDHLTGRWKKYQESVGIDAINFHGLRHTFCTLLAEQGVQIKTAAVLMGHSDINTTAKIYTHVDTEQKKKAIGKLDDLMK